MISDLQPGERRWLFNVSTVLLEFQLGTVATHDNLSPQLFGNLFTISVTLLGESLKKEVDTLLIGQPFYHSLI